MKCRGHVFALLLALSLLLGLGAPALAAETEAEMPKPVILAVSFGTSYTDNLKRSIGGVEAALAKAWPEYEIRRAFTSQTILDILAERDGMEIDNVEQALERLAADGVKDVIVQPTHVVEGYEYDFIQETAEKYVGSFDSLRLGHALLGPEDGTDKLVSALAPELRRWAHKDTAIVLVGHGTEHSANAAYAALQEALTAAGYDKVFVGTIEARPALEDVLSLVGEAHVGKVVLLPLMIVAGDHANNDIAGDGDDSWKSAFESAGYKVQCVLKGLGEYRGVQALISANVRNAEPVGIPAEEPVEEPADEPVEEPMEEPVEEPAEEPVEEPSEEPSEEPEEAPFTTPGVMASDLAPGVYPLDVKTSSSLFRVKEASLAVEEDGMYALLTLDGRRYGEMFLGTAADAEQASEEEIIPFRWSEDGDMVFALPVTSLDTELDCAVWSIGQGRWLDRILILSSALLPEEAFAG